MAIKTSKDQENDYSKESVFQCTRWLRPEDRKGPRNQKGGSKDQNKQRKETLKCKNHFQSTVIREYSSCLSPCSSGLSPGYVDGISLVTLAAGRRDNQILPIPWRKLRDMGGCKFSVRCLVVSGETQDERILGRVCGLFLSFQRSVPRGLRPGTPCFLCLHSVRFPIMGTDSKF